MMNVEVVDLRLVNGDGKLKALVAVKFSDSLIVRGFSVLDGKKGVFVKLPSKLAKDGRWIDTIAVDDFLKQAIEDKVLDQYESASKEEA